MLNVDKMKNPRLSTEKIRVTQVQGSIEANKVKEIVKDIKKKKEEASARKMKRNREKQEGNDSFIRCKTACVCNKVCTAIGFKQCPVCLSVLRSVCSKAACQKDGNVVVQGRGGQALFFFFSLHRNAYRPREARRAGKAWRAR